MADPKTTFRTDEYRRSVPYGVLTPNTRLVVEQRRNASPEVLKHVGNNVKDIMSHASPKYKTWRELVADYPFIEDIANEMVKARLSVYNDEEPGAGDKSVGWIEQRIAQPNASFYSVKMNPKTGEFDLIPSDTGKQRAAANPEEAFKMQQAVYDWLDTDADKITFKKGKREDAGDGHWFRTMDEYSDALLNDLGSEYSMALQDLLTLKLRKIMEEDLGQENPKYLNAMKRKFLPDFDYTQGNPSYKDFRRAEDARNNNRLDRSEFQRASKFKTIPASLALPIWSATHFDPELNYKTSHKEAAGRVAGDVALNTASVLGPALLARGGSQLATRTVPYFRNLAGTAGAFAGGAAGGGATYALQRGVDAGLEKTTGKGYHLYPVDAGDIGLQMLLAGATSIPFRQSVPSYRDLKLMLDPKTNSATSGDVRAMIQSVKEAQSATKKGGATGTGAVKDKYIEKAFVPYENEYAQGGAYEITPPPKPFPKKASGLDNYVKLHSDYFGDIPIEEKNSLWELIHGKDPFGRDVKYKGGKPFTMGTKQFKQEKAVSKGDVVIKGDKKDSDPAKRYILYTHSKPGTVDVSGNFQPATPKQQQMYDKANADARRRYGHKELGYSQLFPRKDENKFFGGRKLAKVPAALQLVTHNVSPVSNLMLGVQPTEYTLDKE